jgi:hypothetical protein
LERKEKENPAWERTCHISLPEASLEQTRSELRHKQPRPISQHIALANQEVNLGLKINGRKSTSWQVVCKLPFSSYI